MSRAGKFIPGGSGRKSGPVTPGAKSTGPIRAPGDPAAEPAKKEKKALFTKGGLRKPVPKNRRLPITVMSCVAIGLLVWAAQYIFVVRPAQVREQQEMAQYAEAQKELAEAKAAAEAKEKAEQERLKATRVVVKVDSNPTGADAFLAGEHRATPATFSVPPGTFDLVVHLDGYDDDKQSVKAEADKPVDLGVLTLVQQTGSLALTSPQSDVKYTLTGPRGYTHDGMLPDKLSDLPAGSYRLTATHRDWQLDPISIVLHDRENVEEAVKFPYATVALTSVPPGATVRCGRTIVGQTPLKLTEQRPGRLRLTVDLPPYAFQTLDLTLPEFGNVSQVVTLTRDKDFVAASGMAMVWLPGGYWVGKYPVTQAQLELVGHYNPSFFRRGNRPVDSISWENASAFCDKLTEFERKAGKLPDGYRYALPTESQWSAFVADANIDLAATSRNGSLSSTQDVGFSEPNKYGLYDTLGNVWEWCQDTVDPQGDHSLRGGSWLSSMDNFPTIDTRIMATAKNADRFTGFRVVLVPQ